MYKLILNSLGKIAYDYVLMAIIKNVYNSAQCSIHIVPINFQDKYYIHIFIY